MRSISDFAESLILGDIDSPKKKTTSNTRSGEKDVSHIEVPSDYRSSLIESALGGDTAFVDIPVPEPEPEPEPEITQHDIEATSQEDIVKKLETLLHEFQEVLTEMTSAGMLGVGPGGGQQKAPEVPKVKHLKNTDPWEKRKSKRKRLLIRKR